MTAPAASCRNFYMIWGWPKRVIRAAQTTLSSPPAPSPVAGGARRAHWRRGYHREQTVRLPTIPPCPFNHGIGRMGRTGLHVMIDWHVIVIGRTPDTARIYDYSPIWQSHCSRNMRVPAQDQTYGDPLGLGQNLCQCCGAQCHPAEPVQANMLNRFEAYHGTGTHRQTRFSSAQAFRSTQAVRATARRTQPDLTVPSGIDPA